MSPESARRFLFTGRDGKDLVLKLRGDIQPKTRPPEIQVEIPPSPTSVPRSSPCCSVDCVVKCSDDSNKYFKCTSKVLAFFAVLFFLLCCLDIFISSPVMVEIETIIFYTLAGAAAIYMLVAFLRLPLLLCAWCFEVCKEFIVNKINWLCSSFIFFWGVITPYPPHIRQYFAAKCPGQLIVVLECPNREVYTLKITKRTRDWALFQSYTYSSSVGGGPWGSVPVPGTSSWFSVENELYFLFLWRIGQREKWIFSTISNNKGKTVVAWWKDGSRTAGGRWRGRRPAPRRSGDPSATTGFHYDCCLLRHLLFILQNSPLKTSSRPASCVCYRPIKIVAINEIYRSNCLSNCGWELGFSLIIPNPKIVIDVWVP